MEASVVLPGRSALGPPSGLWTTPAESVTVSAEQQAGLPLIASRGVAEPIPPPDMLM